MTQEIERKFKVKNDDYKKLSTLSYEINQGYLSSDPERTTRIRIVDNKKAYITIKGKTNKTGVSRYEWEKEIPIDDARELMKLHVNNIVNKIRYIVPNEKLNFEVDKFFNKKLTIAEIELTSEDENFDKPTWLGKEITGKKKYYNFSIFSYFFK